MENIASLVNAIVAVPLLGMLFAALSREGGRGRVSNVLSVGIFTVLSNLVVLWRTALQMGGYFECGTGDFEQTE